MKIEVQLNSDFQKTTSYFFDLLEQQISAEIGKPTKLRVNLEYKTKQLTKLNRICECNAKIVEFEKGNLYTIQITNGSNTNEMKYEFKPTKEGVVVVYSENFYSNKKLVEKNSKLMEFVLSYFNKRKIKKKFKLLEKEINRAN